MLTVNFQSRTPVYQQLYDDVVRLVSMGVLKSHTKLPPVRTLAAELGISERSVQRLLNSMPDVHFTGGGGRGHWVINGE